MPQTENDLIQGVDDMNSTEFVHELKVIAKNYDTLYVMGCFGAPMTASNKERYCKNHVYNAQPRRTAMIQKASSDTFGFDCVCLIKGVLWGWDGDMYSKYGGAEYGSNGVPDINADQMIEACSDISTDFSEIEVGEAVWTPGHIGVYIGDGLAVECTPAWKNCVQITACNRTIEGYNRRNWKKHGKLPYIEYTNTKPKEEPKGVCTVEVKILKKGSTGDSVKALQALLKGYGYNIGIYGVDGSFGPATDKAVRAYQKAKGLEVDGSVGPATWAKLLGTK